jgi:hypothetical protein
MDFAPDSFFRCQVIEIRPRPKSLKFHQTIGQKNEGIRKKWPQPPLTTKIALAMMNIRPCKGGETVADTAYTIRSFPEDLHRRAKATAALEGITLRELILKAVREYVEKKGG